MKKSVKIISILMIIAMIVMSASSVSAINVDSVVGEIETNADSTTVAAGAGNVAGTILKYAQWVAIAGAVIILTILGIKYMMGSLEEKAAYKKSMIPLVVGCVIAVAATSIAKFLFSIF